MTAPLPTLTYVSLFTPIVQRLLNAVVDPQTTLEKLAVAVLMQDKAAALALRDLVAEEWGE